MYEQFYGLTDKPFALTPNSRFVFYSRQYREAESQLLYGINNREGFMLVTGPPGAGKTTLCRDLLEKMDTSKVTSALIFNPFLNGGEMLAALLSEFRLAAPPGASRKELLDRLNQFLLSQLAMGKSTVAIFDEAQHLSSEFLEQIRVLSNLETDSEKLIQIVLVGQPELLDKIRTPSMSQLDQRVSIRCQLSHLDAQETERYISHRLNVAGARGQVSFTARAIAEIHDASGGVPRLINLVCDRALLAGYAAQAREIGPEQVRRAVTALRGEESRRSPSKPMPVVPRRSSLRRWFGVAAAGLLTAAAVLAFTTMRPAIVAGERPDQRLWEETLEATPDEAERALHDFLTQFPASDRTGEALLRLAQIQFARGDHDAALETVARLANHNASDRMRARVTLWTTRIHFAAGDTVAACDALRDGWNVTATSTDSNISRQAGELASACAAAATADGTVQP